MKTYSFASALFVFSAVTLSAAPLREADVGARAAWVAHADFDAFRASVAGAQIRDAYPTKAPALIRLQTEVGFDVREHVTGVTAYGTGEKGDGAILVRHKFLNEKLAAWLAQSGKAKPVGAIPTSRFEISLKHFHGGGGVDAPAGVPGKQLLVDFASPGVVVLATDAARLDAAIARLSAVESVVAVPAIYRELKASSPVFSAFANVAAAKAAREGGTHPWAQRLNLAALAVTADSAGFALELRGELLNAELAQSTANLIHALFVAQTPRFPDLEKAKVSAVGNFVNVDVGLPVSQIIAGIPAKKGK
jgi:hypothetical protein